MACNENVIKNMSNEVTRNCQAQNITVEPEFVAYLMELLLLNPKYGKLFTKSLNRNSLAHFVDTCCAMIVRGGTSLHTLKMQFIMRMNYDKLPNLISKHQDKMNACLKPLITEILDADPDPEDEADMRKLFRKISIYIVLASGLGNPSIIMNLKEGIAALESIYTVEELAELLQLPRSERMDRVQELLQITSGVRLFNRDCKMGGEMITELPFDLLDAGKACMSSLSNSLITVIQRVNSLTTAIEDCVGIHEETGNIIVNVSPNLGLTLDSYTKMFDLLIFNRQYELFVRRLLTDVENMVDTSKELVDKYRVALNELHAAVKYKTAVPCDTIFPLFRKLWVVWYNMQNTMFLVSTINSLMSVLHSIQEHNKIPASTLERMLKGKQTSDEARLSDTDAADTKWSTFALSDVSDTSIKVTPPSTSFFSYASAAMLKDKHVAFLGFCALCLNVGALVPSNLGLGVIRYKNARYGFCTAKMAVRFNKDPQRYINEIIEYARNNPHIINLLYIEGMVQKVRDIECLVTRLVPKKNMDDKDIQTEVHAIETYKEHNYNWDLWEWKRQACKWATIVNCKTHSSQTKYSHMRSENHCQTFEHRDRSLQTMKEVGINTNVCKQYLWGLRGKLGEGQHSMDMVLKHAPEKAVVKEVYKCSWPCIGEALVQQSEGSFFSESDSDRGRVFYKPDSSDEEDDPSD